MNQPESADARVEPRTNLFLGAVIRGPSLSVPVKIRNMSVSGALVEGTALPEAGGAVQLMRGRLVLPATVTWCAEGRCGLRFSSLACVRDWMAPPANPSQRRVDEAVRVFQLGAVPMPQRLETEFGYGSQTVQFGEDLLRAMRLVEDLAHELASDADILVRHGERLQNLDIASQTIGVIADGLANGSPDALVAARLGNLRASCAAALEKLQAF